jgi:hypothetical protein
MKFEWIDASHGEKSKALQRTLDDEAQETAGAFRSGKGSAGQNPVELCAHSLGIHGWSNLIMFHL